MKRICIQAALLGLALMLSGCGGMKLWPFGEDKAQGRSSGPKNATLYQCQAGKQFYVRQQGDNAWLIYPDREVALAKGTAVDGALRYSNGIAVLAIKGNEASLNDGPGIAYSGCQAVK